MTHPIQMFKQSRISFEVEVLRQVEVKMKYYSGMFSFKREVEFTFSLTLSLFWKHGLYYQKKVKSIYS